VPYRLIKLKPTILAIFIFLTILVVGIMISVQYYLGLQGAILQTKEENKQILSEVVRSITYKDTLNQNFIELVQNVQDINSFPKGHEQHPIYFFITTYLEKYNDVYGIYLGYENENFYEILNLDLNTQMRDVFQAPKEAKWLVLKIQKEGDKRVRNEEFLDAQHRIILTQKKETTYNPTIRPWYVKAQQSTKVEKTEPYMFANFPSAGVTYSKKVPNAQVVIGVDITFDAIEKQLKTLPIVKGSLLFLFDKEAKPLASNTLNKFNLNQTHPNDETIMFNGITYLQNIIALNDVSNNTLVLLVPYDTIIQPHLSQVYYSILIALISLIFIVPIIVYFMRVIIQPIHLIDAQSEKIKQRNYTGVTLVDTFIYEFDMLSHSLLDMANTIHTYEEEQKNNSNALLQQYKNTIDRSSIVSKADKKGIITYANEQFCKISGYTQEELLGQPHNIVRHPDMPKEVFENLWHTILVEEKVWMGEVKNRRKDGSSYWVQSIINPIFDAQGEIIEYIGIRTDITQQKTIAEHFEKELNITSKNFDHAMHLSKEYEKAIDSSNILSRANKGGKITYVNDEFLKLSGFGRNEVLGKTHSIISSPDVPREFYKELWDTIKQGNIWNGIIKNRRKDTTPFWAATSIVPIKDEENEIVEFMAIRHDLTKLFELHHEIEATQKEIVYKMGEIGESRSKETGNHVKRVAEYSRLLANLYGLSYEESEILFTASPMHDIGKVGIPDNVLKKPAKLNEEEWVIMKSHTTSGYEILKNSNRTILKAAAIVAYEHHEKWDGSGYPRGLKEDEIHIYGRITAIADVFDALGSHRCYKAAWDDEKIFALFHEERGKHFDPKLVDLFFENLEKFLYIRDTLKDEY
jgi:PAS domain S-box-containing protein